MYSVKTKLVGIAPYSQSKHYSTPKLPKETPKDYEARTWKDRLHVDANGNVFIPAMAFKNALDDVAKYLSVQIPGKGKSTYTKHVQAGVMVFDDASLGVKASDVRGEWLFVPSDGVAGSGKRVEKCFPWIGPGWTVDVTWHIVDETVTLDVFKQFLSECGKFIGLGRFRPRNRGNYGRFEVASFDVV